MIIEVRKDEKDPTYMVRIADDIYEMSTYADLPNGVCMYSGPFIKDADVYIPPLVDVPIGIVRQIVYILERENN